MSRHGTAKSGTSRKPRDLADSGRNGRTTLSITSQAILRGTDEERIRSNSFEET